MADALIVVDTDLFVDYLRGHGRGASAVEDLLRRDMARFSAMTAFEVRLGTDFVQRQDLIERVLSSRTVPLDYPAAIVAGELFARFRSAGLEIGETDCLIAGTCLRHGFPLATRNVKHFGRVEGLQLFPIGGA